MLTMILSTLFCVFGVFLTDIPVNIVILNNSFFECDDVIQEELFLICGEDSRDGFSTVVLGVEEELSFFVKILNHREQLVTHHFEEGDRFLDIIFKCVMRVAAAAIESIDFFGNIFIKAFKKLFLHIRNDEAVCRETADVP